jgi:hypothetical protein
MSEIVQDSAIQGNTNPSIAKKQPNPDARWCFTLNNYTEKEYEEIVSALIACKYTYIIGKEVGEQGTPHLQGYFETDTRVRPSSLKLSHKRTHFEKARGTDLENYKYCSKENKFIDNFSRMWKVKNGIIKIKCIEETEFFKWQMEVVKYYYKDYKEPNDRNIYWIYDPVGCVGKTALCKWFVIKKDFGYLNNAKTSDICFYAKENPKEGYVFDFCRSNEDKINYQAIESLKNGILFSPKYESGVLLMDSPIIFCFSNFEPDTSMMSKDRWKVIRIETNKQGGKAKLLP